MPCSSFFPILATVQPDKAKIKSLLLIFAILRRGAAREFVRYTSGLLEDKGLSNQSEQHLKQETEGKRSNRKV